MDPSSDDQTEVVELMGEADNVTKLTKCFENFDKLRMTAGGQDDNPPELEADEADLGVALLEFKAAVIQENPEAGEMFTKYLQLKARRIWAEVDEGVPRHADTYMFAKLAKHVPALDALKCPLCDYKAENSEDKDAHIITHSSELVSDDDSTAAIGMAARTLIDDMGAVGVLSTPESVRAAHELFTAYAYQGSKLSQPTEEAPENVQSETSPPEKRSRNE